MRVLQASPEDPTRAIEMAWMFRCSTIAWDIRKDCEEALAAATSARIRSEGWYSVARDEVASLAHPEWMHMPQLTEWCRGAERRLVAPYIGLNNREAFAYARQKLAQKLELNTWCHKLWLADIQGPPMGCGCGNPSCRSWDNSPGPKIVGEQPYDLPDRFFSEVFFEAVMQDIWQLDRPMQIYPVLCPECERVETYGIAMDTDGPDGTDLCSGHRCWMPCAGDYWPELLARFRNWGSSLFVPHVGLLLMCDALGKNVPALPNRSWPVRAHERYGHDLFPCVEPADAHNFDHCLILLDAPQDVLAVPAPSRYEPALRGVNA